ncbi:MAG: uroporphyrinogen decarboxylase family protein, partial [Phycisphaerae bacterium]|nr:uroporphyrinogen decarboxylase family protein [Phycisphaerae bacterium]
MMTSRERWQAVLSGKKADRAPSDYWATGEVTSRLLRELNCADVGALARKLDIDLLRGVGPTYVGPKFSQCDMWGLARVRKEYAGGAGTYDEVVANPLAKATTIAEVNAYPWPSADWYDYKAVQPKLDALGDWPRKAATYEPFLLYCQLRGQEQALMDLAMLPDLAEAILTKIFNFFHTVAKRTFESARPGSIDVTYVAEDLGTQHSLLMSLPMIDRFLLSNMKRMIDLAHSFGIKVMHHDDGACRPVIPRMIDIGIDILNPVQWRCPGMEIDGLKRDFGKDLCFHGAIDNQHTLPF